MVEFVLLFALGFLSALLLGLVLAPAVFGRVVRYTEKRVYATVPISSRELKAARDMERAAFAVENSRVSISLRNERDRRVGESELTQQINALSIDAADLRSSNRQERERADALRLALSETEERLSRVEEERRSLSSSTRRLSSDLEAMRIDLATRETELESLRSSLEMVSEERRRLRDATNTAETRSKDLQFRLEREEGRSAALEARLTENVAKIVDQESTIERRTAEIARLRDRLKTATADLRALEKAGQKLTEESRVALNGTEQSKGLPMEINGQSNDASSEDSAQASKIAISQRVERLRARHTALVDRLVAANDSDGDQELRSEIKEIAASMISLTAAREGASSPIYAILSNVEAEQGANFDAARQSLGTRAAAQLHD
jgi:chromosome segregation ATPase